MMQKYTIRYKNANYVKENFSWVEFQENAQLVTKAGAVGVGLVYSGSLLVNHCCA